MLLEITFKGEQGLFNMGGGYSAFSHEDEILIQDGLQYEVTNRSEMKMQTEDDEVPISYQLIQLQYPPTKKSPQKLKQNPILWLYFD